MPLWIPGQVNIDTQYIPLYQGPHTLATHTPLYQGPYVTQPNQATSSCPATSCHTPPVWHMPAPIHDCLQSYHHQSWQQQPQGSAVCKPNGHVEGSRKMMSVFSCLLFLERHWRKKETRQPKMRVAGPKDK